MKTRTKSVIILMITLFTVIMIGTTKVSAVEIEITDEMRNQENYSETEQQKVNNIAKSINGTVVITPELSEMEKEYNETFEKPLKPLKEAGYTFVSDGIYGAGGVFYCEGRTNYSIYKNDIYYGTISIDVRANGMVTIPSHIEDTETAITNYATPKIEDYLKKQQFLQNNESVILKKYNGDYYRVSNAKTQELIETILLKKEPTTTTTKEDTTTGIKVVGNFASKVVLESKKVTEQKTIDTVKKAFPETTYQWTVYDINLLRDGAKIQPNGKVKVSIPIPKGYDKTKLEIYRVEENGKTIKYDVKVEGNYATFETDHFSIYVLAEKKAETTTTTTPTKPTQEQTKPVNKGEKDNTPKTGITDITKYIVAVAIISAVGIIALKKKETK